MQQCFDIDGVLSRLVARVVFILQWFDVCGVPSMFIARVVFILQRCDVCGVPSNHVVRDMSYYSALMPQSSIFYILCRLC